MDRPALRGGSLNAPAAPPLQVPREPLDDHPVGGLRRRNEGPRPGDAARAREDRRLLERYHLHGDRTAREAVVERFLPLARQLARRYQRGSEPLDDLVQVASVGLLKAIDRFDPDRAIAFSSFAVPTMLGEIKRHFRDKAWSVRPPRDLQDLALRIDRAKDELALALAREPTLAEIATSMGATVERLLEAREAAAAYHAASLDAPSHDDGEEGQAIADTLGGADPGYRLVEHAATVERLMSAVSDREREVLHLRFAEDLTQSEIAARVGVSQMHVSRLIRQALARLSEAAQTDASVD